MKYLINESSGITNIAYLLLKDFDKAIILLTSSEEIPFPSKSLISGIRTVPTSASSSSIASAIMSMGTPWSAKAFLGRGAFACDPRQVPSQMSVSASAAIQNRGSDAAFKRNFVV